MKSCIVGFQYLQILQTLLSFIDRNAMQGDLEKMTNFSEDGCNAIVVTSNTIGIFFSSTRYEEIHEEYKKE